MCFSFLSRFFTVCPPRKRLRSFLPSPFFFFSRRIGGEKRFVVVPEERKKSSSSSTELRVRNVYVSYTFYVDNTTTTITTTTIMTRRRESHREEEEVEVEGGKGEKKENTENNSLVYGAPKSDSMNLSPSLCLSLSLSLSPFVYLYLSISLSLSLSRYGEGKTCARLCMAARVAETDRATRRSAHDLHPVTSASQLRGSPRRRLARTAVERSVRRPSADTVCLPRCGRRLGGAGG